jgi:outer membrane protein TolC
MERLNSIYILFFILIINAPMQGQTLDSLFHLAAANNLELNLIEQEYQAALLKVPQVGELPDPEASLGFFAMPPETRLGPQWVKVGGMQMFPWKSYRRAKKEVVIAMAQAEYERFEVLKWDLYYQIEKHYITWQELNFKQGIIRENIQQLKVLERLATAKVETGRASAADVLRVHLKIQDAEEKLRLLENMKTKPRIAINQILHRPLDTEIQWVEEQPRLADMPSDKGVVEAGIRANHPLFSMLSAKQQIARKNLVVNKEAQRPTFGAGLDYVLVTKRRDMDPKYNGRDIIMPMAKVKIPLYRKKYGAKEQEEQLRIDILEAKKEVALERFLAMVEQAYVSHEDARLKLDSYREQEKTIASIIEILTTEYTVKGANFEELIKMQLQLQEYQLKTLEAIIQSHLAKTEVNRFYRKE